jgi:hypothetical protein
MKISKTISLELLRHGPSHNQLLSPLTPYLALCDGHDAETINLPFEHHEFVAQTPALRYSQGSPAKNQRRRSQQVQQIARQMAGLLGLVPGLNTTLGPGGGDPAALTHLELVLSASELSLLPFEIADSPRGFAAAGLPLCLQTVTPVSLTRRNRRHTGLGVKWPVRPRVLVAVCLPEAQRQLALSHVATLRKALDPWIAPRESSAPNDNPSGRELDLTNLIDVIENATLRDIQEHCQRRPYTHVHILAHGTERREIVGKRFVLALPDRPGSVLRGVDGKQLASALRPHAELDRASALASPAVVTLACCDGGNVGDIVLPGASIAHDLHEAGIPLVVASQYPLTFEGSVLMTAALYERLLWGDDPRVVLHDMRQRLAAQLGETHDWGSIVAYAALPPDLERQLVSVRAHRAREAADAALAWFDMRLAAEEADGIRKRLRSAERRLETILAALLADGNDLRPLAVSTEGMLATLHKRNAEILYKNLVRKEVGAGQEISGEVRLLLLAARERYREGLRIDKANHWFATQCLYLSRILGDPAPEDDRTLGTVALFSARQDLQGTDVERVGNALSTLIELSLLAPDQVAAVKADEHAKELVERVGQQAFVVRATARQLARYGLWRPLEALQERASQLRARLEGGAA